MEHGTPSSKPPVANRPIILFVALAAAIGLPTAAVSNFPDWVREHPWSALVLLLLYEAGIVTLGFVTKVWKQLESRWTGPVVDWLDGLVRECLFGYRKDYLQYLTYRHRSFDVKGLKTHGPFTLELQKVFVDLSITAAPEHQIAANPIPETSERLHQDRNSIWDYFAAGRQSLGNLTILGPPGCGKTTLLKHATLILATSRKLRKNISTSTALPILLFLRDHAQAIDKNPRLSLAEAVCDSLMGLKRAIPAPWFGRKLDRGRCLIMLDGLDEIADPTVRRKVVTWVEGQMTTHGNNRFVVTSRPLGYRDNPLSNVTMLEVRSFTAEQVKQFVNNWYLANEIQSYGKDDPGVRMEAKAGAEDLLRRLRNTSALSDLSVNPLLLTMIATVHRYRSSLPGRRIELYAEICEVFLGKRQQAKGLDLDLTPAQKQRVLESLAHHMMCQQKRDVAAADALKVIGRPLAAVSPRTLPQDFLKQVVESSGLLVERENELYSFAHLTFQEYLAASHIQQQRLGKDLNEKVGDSWWHETIRLYAAQADATPIMTACLAGSPPAVSALVLAIECLEEAREIQPQTRAQLETVLALKDQDPEQQKLVGEALLALRLRRMSRIDEDRYVDSSLVTNIEYQLFLDEMRAAGEYRQPDHWREYRFPAGEGGKPVVGMRSSDAVAFCEWLTRREMGQWYYRLPHLGEFDPVCLKANPRSELTAEIGYWVISSGTNAFALEEVPETGNADKSIALDFDHTLALARACASDLDLDLDLIPDFDLTRAFNFDRALTRDLVHTLSSDLVSNLAFERASNPAFERASNFASNSARALGRALARALASDPALGPAPALALALALVSDLASDRASNFASDRALAFARALASNLTPSLASDLAPDLARALDLDLDFARASAVDFDLARAFDLDLDLARASALDFDLALALVLVPDHAPDLVGTSEPDFARALALARALDHALTLIHEQNRKHEYNGVPDGYDWEQTSAFLTSFTVLCSAKLLITFARSLNHSNKYNKKYIKYYYVEALSSFCNMCKLRYRLKERLPAFEGIRIAKVRLESSPL